MDFDFAPIEEAPLGASRSRGKLTKEQKAQLLENLGVAIEKKSLSDVKDLIDQGVDLRANAKIHGEKVGLFAIKNFDKNILDALSEGGLTVANYKSVLRETVILGDPVALEWVIDFGLKNKERLSWGDIFQNISYQGQVKNLKMLLDKIEQCGGNISVSSNYKGLSFWSVAHALSLACKEKDQDLFDNLLTIPGIDLMSGDHLKKESAVVGSFINHLLPSMSYAEVSWLHSQLGRNLDFENLWETCFPKTQGVPTSKYLSGELDKFDKNKYKPHEPIKATNLLEYLVVRGASSLATVASSPSGRKAILGIFKNPRFLEGFFIHARNDVSIDVFNKLMPDLAQWTDERNNNLGHLILAHSPNKLWAGEIYRWDKNLLLAANQRGHIPLDMLEGAAKTAMSKKLLKRTLNDSGVGLIQKRSSKSPTRRM